jgi:hypothetical protein
MVVMVYVPLSVETALRAAERDLAAMRAEVEAGQAQAARKASLRLRSDLIQFRRELGSLPQRRPARGGSREPARRVGGAGEGALDAPISS